MPRNWHCFVNHSNCCEVISIRIAPPDCATRPSTTFATPRRASLRHTEIRGQQHTHYVMWPFAIRSERLVPGYGWERRRLYLPAYAAIDGAGRETRAYGLFGYVHTVDTRHGVESTGAPWPFVVRERALGETEFRVWRPIR